jgi:hypothetical protein
MSETTVQAALQTALQGMSEFDNADVTVNDWGILDGPVSNAPYAIIESSDTFNVQWSMSAVMESSWQIPFTLIVAFTDWDTSLNNFRVIRQAVIDMLDGSTDTTLGGAVRRVRSDGPIGQIYSVEVVDPAYATPAFLSQRIIVEMIEY